MHRELVERRRWISEERFLHALNYCMLLPGPEAQQLAIYIGWLLHRTWGGIVAGAFFVIPSIFVLLALSYIYAAHGNVPAVAGVLSGFKPIVVAIVVEAVIKIGGKALKRWAHFVIAADSPSFLFTSFTFLSRHRAGAPPSSGCSAPDTCPDVFAAASPRTKEADRKTEGGGELTEALPLVIDDHAPPPAHTLPNRITHFQNPCYRSRALDIASRGTDCLARMGKPARSGIPFLHPSGSGHFRRRLRRARLCDASRRRLFRLDDERRRRSTDWRWLRPRPAADHGASVRWFHGRVE